MAEHTPGQWSVGDRRPECFYVRADCYKSEDGHTHPSICSCTPWGDHWPFLKEEECRANARLIAAAPELLEACETVARYLDELKGAGLAPLALNCRSAVAKATGTDPT